MLWGRVMPTLASPRRLRRLATQARGFRHYLALPAVIAVLTLATCRGDQGPESPTQGAESGSGPSFATTSPSSVTLVGAGNIARCDRTNDDATANLLDSIPGTVFALGDNAYPGGTATTYTNCYNPTWGRQKARTYPVLGNHEYDSSTAAAGYFGYFSAAAGATGRAVRARARTGTSVAHNLISSGTAAPLGSKQATGYHEQDAGP